MQPRVYAPDWDKATDRHLAARGALQPMLYCDEVWTGLEFQVAGHMLYEGEVESALHLVRAAYDRHDGVYRNPWNEIECGDHYVRPMAAWWMLEAAGGRAYHAAHGLLAFDPRGGLGELRSAAGFGPPGERAAIGVGQSGAAHAASGATSGGG